MQDTQRKWGYLETLFIGSDEVKKELPESTERFVGIDKTFKECLGAIYKIKNAVAATDVEPTATTLRTADPLALSASGSGVIASSGSTRAACTEALHMNGTPCEIVSRTPANTEPRKRPAMLTSLASLSARE